MYLMNLSENVKNTFLELAYIIAAADNHLSDKEKVLMEAYKSELQVAFDDQAYGSRNLEEIILSLCKDANETDKKIIVFEIIGLAMTDNLYDETEKKIVKQINEAFHLDDAYPLNCELLINKYIELQSQIDALVTEH